MVTYFGRCRARRSPEDLSGGQARRIAPSSGLPLNADLAFEGPPYDPIRLLSLDCHHVSVTRVQ